MTRINVYRNDEYDGKTLDGWFDPKTATRYDSGTEWDGNNHISVITGSQWVDEYLYRTKGGRWVLNHDATRYHNGSDDYRFITDEQARDWLLRSRINDTAVEEHFGEIEEERGPGRPEVGKPINVRLGDDLLARVDAAAAERGKSRADLLRELVAQALG
jgi:hypothetical protein